MENKPILHLLKIGGAIVDDPVLLQEALGAFAAVPHARILVHGGGQVANDLAHKLGIEPIMLNGRRVTDEATLDLVTMVYAGLLNKRMVAGLQALDCNGLGLSGADLNIIRARLRPPHPVDYGFAGDIQEVNVPQLDQLLQAGIAPVVCAITHDKSGQLLNTNADTIASSLATAMSALYEVELYYCFTKPGVLADPDKPETVIPDIHTENYLQLKSSGVIRDGMIPKLENAFLALERGVSRVIIGSVAAIHPDSKVVKTVIRR